MTPPLPDSLYLRVLARCVRASSGCLEWQGATSKRGHGRIKFKGKLYLPHRIVLEHVLGPLPRHVLACHRCDNPRCVEPTHLFPGTYRDNQIDAIEKGRSKMPSHDEKNRRAVAESNRRRRANLYRNEERDMTIERPVAIALRAEDARVAERAIAERAPSVALPVGQVDAWTAFRAREAQWEARRVFIAEMRQAAGIPEEAP
jgi:hypothetical protein